MDKNRLVLGFADSFEQAQAFAAQLDCDYEQAQIRQFPDGETLIRLPPKLPPHVVFFRSLDHPNDKLIELYLMARTARDKGVRRLSLICPYLCYMRQDIENTPGEIVSQKIIGGWLAELFDDVITVDPHLHRITFLIEAIPLPNAVSLSAAPLMGAYIAARFPDAVLFGPDEESQQWVHSAAQHSGLDFAVGHKVRHGDKQVEVTLPDYNFDNKRVVILDDMASTGRTLARAAALLRVAGAQHIACMVTHALFCGDCEQHLLQNGIDEVWSTDSIAHHSNVISLAEMLAREFEKLAGGKRPRRAK